MILKFCNHKYKNGKSALVFPEKIKWCGVYPQKIKALCPLCKQTVEITQEEYNKVKVGE